MRPTNLFDAILFDLGDTLFEPLDVKFQQNNLAMALQESGISLSLEEAQSKFRRIRTETEETLRNQPFYLHRDLVSRSVSAFLKSCGATPHIEVVTDFCDRQGSDVVQHLRLRSDCVGTLTKLRSKGVRMAIVSNIDENYLQPLLQRTAIDQFMEFCLSSERAQSCKPDSRIFQYALSKLSLAPQRVLYVGDSEANDIVGAKALGMHAALLSMKKPAFTNADFVIKGLVELLDRIG